MSDLIRKSDVLDLLYRIFDKYKMSTDKNTSIGKSFGTDVFEEIRNMPTAYSVDEVVAELEKLKNEKTIGSHKVMIKDAIEIVKQGGVSDDACEWKYNDSEYYFESSCDHLHIFMSDGPKENEYNFALTAERK